MATRWRAAAAALCAAALVAAQPGAAASPAARQGLVIQASDADPRTWSLALDNARNVAAELGAENVEIEIVVYGPAIDMLRRGSPVAQRIDEATLSGMRVVACENTMIGHGIRRPEMIDGIGYVKAGVVEIMRRQRQGWTYLRP